MMNLPIFSCNGYRSIETESVQDASINSVDWFTAKNVC